MGAPVKFWQRGYIYVADEEGNEIAGSRRELAGCETMDDYRALWMELAGKMGEGCQVKHSPRSSSD